MLEPPPPVSDWGEGTHIVGSGRVPTLGLLLSVCWPVTEICNYHTALIIGRENKCCNFKKTI